MLFVGPSGLFRTYKRSALTTLPSLGAKPGKEDKMAKVRSSGDKTPRGTRYILWFQGYRQCFRVLASAQRALKSLSWAERQDAAITDINGVEMPDYPESETE